MLFSSCHVSCCTVVSNVIFHVCQVQHSREVVVWVVLSKFSKPQEKKRKIISPCFQR